MNLYIWNDPYRVRFGGSCLIVAAESLTVARVKAREAVVLRYGSDSGKLDLLQRIKGKPDTVLPKAPAVVYEWSE